MLFGFTRHVAGGLGVMAWQMTDAPAAAGPSHTSGDRGDSIVLTSLQRLQQMFKSVAELAAMYSTLLVVQLCARVHQSALVAWC